MLFREFHKGKNFETGKKEKKKKKKNGRRESRFCLIRRYIRYRFFRRMKRQGSFLLLLLGLAFSKDGSRGRRNDKKNGRRRLPEARPAVIFTFSPMGEFGTRNVALLQRRDSLRDRRTDGKGKVKVRRKIYGFRKLIGRVMYRVGPKTSFPSLDSIDLRILNSFFKGVTKMK